MEYMKNKRGTSLGGWTEAILGVILILTCLAIIVGNMNVTYNQNNDGSFGMSSEGTMNQFKAYQGTLEAGMQGEASTNSINGISLATTWGIIKYGLSMIFDALTGQWITNSVGLLHWGSAGDALALVLRLLYVFSLGFILLKLILKVNP